MQIASAEKQQQQNMVIELSNGPPTMGKLGGQAGRQAFRRAGGRSLTQKIHFVTVKLSYMI